jgi:S-adenosylmethionine hydrolase
LGVERKKVNEKILFKPAVEKNIIKGIIIYIDSFENVITNITEQLFKKIGKGRKFSVLFRGESINKIYKSYNDVPVGEIVAIFGSNGHLEIAINQGNASGLLGLGINDTVMIEFEG